MSCEISYVNYSLFSQCAPGPHPVPFPRCYFLHLQPLQLLAHPPGPQQQSPMHPRTPRRDVMPPSTRAAPGAGLEMMGGCASTGATPLSPALHSDCDGDADAYATDCEMDSDPSIYLPAGLKGQVPARAGRHAWPRTAERGGGGGRSRMSGGDDGRASGEAARRQGWDGAASSGAKSWAARPRGVDMEGGASGDFEEARRRRCRHTWYTLLGVGEAQSGGTVSGSSDEDAATRVAGRWRPGRHAPTIVFSSSQQSCRAHT